MSLRRACAPRCHAVWLKQTLRSLSSSGSTLNINPLGDFQVPSPNSIDASRLQIEKTKNPKPKLPKEQLVFGQHFSDHMLDIDWKEKGGWSAPVIKPYGDFSISPAASVLHYAMECFEGMKAYKDAHGNIRLFRPELNMQRFNHSLKRMYLPAVDGTQFLKLLRELLLIDKDWIPEGDGYSLYIRPTCIATNRSLGVGKSDAVKVYAITSPVGPYYKEGFKPIRLWADTTFVRAWPGGSGDAKVGANYAISIMPQMLASQHGCSQVLWLYGPEHSVTEVGAMNLFVLWKNKDTGRPELVTAPLSRGDILPGVTRASVIELARSWPDCDVGERNLTMKQLVEASDEGRLLEVFGAGTAAVICPVKGIKYGDRDIQVPTGEDVGPVAKKLWKTITDIQYGRTDHSWSVKL